MLRWLLLVVALILPVTVVSGEAPVERLVTVRLTADLAGLSDAERRMLPLLREAALAVGSVFRPGGYFYPPDVTREALEKAAVTDPLLKDPHAVVIRAADGRLQAVPYHRAFSRVHALAADRLRAAADLAGDAGLARYLRLRAEALLTDRYRASDMAWMEMRDNRLDLVIGPIETYEDRLLGVKAAHEALLLVRDREWDRRLERYTRRLGEYQSRLPVPPAYRSETPGAESDLGVYDVLLMTGDAANTRPIAINLPNDEEVQLQKGARRLQLRNVMRAKFERILLPMARELLDAEQFARVTFEALFLNTLFHEVAHGLGIKKRVDGSGMTVTDALREDAWMMEEGKADALALFLGDLDEALDRVSGSEGRTARYLTEFASLFRAIRFGPESAHARANLIRFQYLREQGAITRTAGGRYRADLERMESASRGLAERILRLQGDGDAEGVRALERRYGVVSPELAADLRRVEDLAIPTDVAFEESFLQLTFPPQPVNMSDHTER
ncbi:MAG: Zn-dependent hydrolase [Magnetococcales bacterium]|nr:Zn-dependent hydrolase [Magnetococcales bacterium]